MPIRFNFTTNNGSLKIQISNLVVAVFAAFVVLCIYGIFHFIF